MFISVYFFDVVYEPPLICISYRHKAENGGVTLFLFTWSIWSTYLCGSLILVGETYTSLYIWSTYIAGVPNTRHLPPISVYQNWVCPNIRGCCSRAYEILIKQDMAFFYYILFSLVRKIMIYWIFPGRLKWHVHGCIYKNAREHIENAHSYRAIIYLRSRQEHSKTATLLQHIYNYLYIYIGGRTL